MTDNTVNNTAAVIIMHRIEGHCRYVNVQCMSCDIIIQNDACSISRGISRLYIAPFISANSQTMDYTHGVKTPDYSPRFSARN